MHHSIDEIKQIVEKNEKLKEKVFCRGYFITDNHTFNLSDYPFYGNWKKYQAFDFDIIVHKDQHIYTCFSDTLKVFLIGNALNPFDGIYDENIIVKKISKIIIDTNDISIDCIQYINQLTGSFFIGIIRETEFTFMTDPTEMLFSVQGILDDKFYVSSHTQLIGDLCQPKRSEYINRLERYKYFYKYGVFFPGCLTQYQQIERVLTNFLYKYKDRQVSYKRIFPLKPIIQTKSKNEYKELIKDVSSILRDTMKYAAKKWKKPAISLTGGMDSKTTLSLCKGFEDKFFVYSYISMDGDKIDAEAAHKISDSIGVDHSIINIPSNDFDYLDIEDYRAIMEHNLGGYKLNDNDVRKRIYFNNTDLYDVEIKSWISEIARANYYKKFGLKKMPDVLTARNMTSMYKVFLHDRKLVKETDKVFEDYIIKTGFNNLPGGYDASDMYLWEFRYSSWGGMVISLEHSFSYEIFIPYNNRLLLELMLQAPLKKRITDEFHEDLIAYNNKAISETGITITNWNETKKRMYIEKLYFLLTSKFDML